MKNSGCSRDLTNRQGTIALVIDIEQQLCSIELMDRHAAMLFPDHPDVLLLSSSSFLAVQLPDYYDTSLKELRNRIPDSTNRAIKRATKHFEGPS